MFRPRVALAALAVVACSKPDPTSLPPEVRAAADAIDSTQLRADVTYLASDALLGRSTLSMGMGAPFAVSPGFDSAAAYVVRRLAMLDLKPMGDSGTFRQHYALRRLLLDSSATHVEVGGRRFALGKDFMVMNFTDTGTTAAAMSYVGHGIRVPKRKIDPFNGVTIKGRMLITHGPGVLPPGETYKTMGTLGTDWDDAERIGANEGASALAFINPPPMLAFWNRRGLRAGARASVEMWPSVPSWFARLPMTMLWVTPALASALLAGAPGGAPGAAQILAKAAAGNFAQSFDLPAASTVTIRLALDSVKLAHPYNIVAMIEGSDARLKREAVVFGAHLDGSVGPPMGPDTIYNAADDNASGSASLLAIASAMMRAPRPKRSVIFVWDSGEEMGLWGSRFFATHPPVPLANIVTYYNVDMIGRTKKPGTNIPGQEGAGPDEIFLAGSRALSSGLDSLLERTNREYLNIKVNHEYDRADHEYFYPRTDAEPMVTRGVITLNYMNNEHEDYHGPGDESSKLDLAKMTRVTKTIFAGGWMVASIRARPVVDKPLPATIKRFQ